MTRRRRGASFRVAVLCGLCVAAAHAPAAVRGQTPRASTARAAEQSRWVNVSAGVTRSGRPLPAVIDRGALDFASSTPTVMLVGGTDGMASSVAVVERALAWARGAGAARMGRLSLSAVTSANPDGVAAATGPMNGSNGRVDRGYPPKGDGYGSPTDPEAAYLWRWLALQAPDLVVVVSAGARLAWRVPDALHGRFPEAEPLTASDALAFQLGAVPAAGVGTIPAIEVIVPADVELMPPLLEALARGGPLSASPARVEMRRRITRSPKDITELLAGVYGHDVTDLVYMQTMQLIGRVRAGATSDVERLLEPWTSGGKPPLPERPTSSHFSGHLVFSELHRATGDPRYRDLMRDVANLAFDQQGAPREAMPLHNEMSDAFFMGSPILAAAGRATGDAKYFAMALRNARFIGNLTRRPDGLHRHSPLDDTAWGRGNGFAAFGLALAIDEMPDGTAERAEMIATLSSHLSALLPFQDETGMWHQVIDHPESYREFSVTALLAYVMQRGVAIGWLDRRQVGPAIDRAWYAIRSRIGSDGGLVDVCTSTGKMKSLREYLDRPAVLGIDARGGGMALVLAAELAGLHDAAVKR